MARQNIERLAFNRGVVSPLAAARVDVKRIAMSAKEQINFMPRVLGPMSLRPGLEFITQTRNDDAARYIPFVFSVEDTALVEITTGAVRVIYRGVPITRSSTATSTISNPDFTTDLTNWTQVDESVYAVSQWQTGGYMYLRGDGTKSAQREQTVTLSGSGEHAIRIVVYQGEVDLRIGSSSGADDYLNRTTLGRGTHSLTFTPTTNFYVCISNAEDVQALVTSCSIEAASSIMEITAPWDSRDLPYIRYTPSGDILFIACKDLPPMKIERRAAKSWSVVYYEPKDGPFMAQNITPITMTTNLLSGLATITASRPYFRSSNVGSLIRLDSQGQAVDKALSAADVFSDPIRIAGLTADRNLDIATSGTWSATLTLQRSVGEPGNWVDVTTYVVNTTTTYNDGYDNEIIWYRLGIKTGDYTSGAAAVSLTYEYGSISGVARITTYTDDQTVEAVVLKDFGGVAATSNWAEGAWSDRRGYPSAVAVHEGRLWWAGKDKLWGSASDAYYTYGDDPTGDAGAISRSIGIGPVDSINWLVSGDTLVMGGQGGEFTCRSSSLDEPITPTNFKIKMGTTIGSTSVEPQRVDNSIFFVDRSAQRVHEITNETFTNALSTKEMTALVPEIGKPAIRRTAVQRKIDTRMHCVLSDGTAAVLVFDKVEEVTCWVKVETDGDIEDVVVLPEEGEEDGVYYVVKRGTKRCLEKWAQVSECEGGTINKQADSFVLYESLNSDTLTGLDHIEGSEVVVWADGRYDGTYTVTGGSVTLPASVTDAVAGIGYAATFESTKLAYAAQGGSALSQVKRVDHVALILHKTHYQGIQYGDSWDYMDDLPLVEQGIATPADTIWENFDSDAVELNGSYNADSRLCLKATAPKPCTVLAAIVSMSTYEKL